MWTFGMRSSKKSAPGYGKIIGLGSIATIAGGLGSEFLNSQLVDVATRVGLPLVLLAIMTRYSWAMIADKDAEIKRLNEARIRETLNHADRLYKVTAAARKMADQSTATLGALTRNRHND